MVAWLGPIVPAAGKPKVTAVIRGIQRAVADSGRRPPHPRPASAHPARARGSVPTPHRARPPPVHGAPRRPPPHPATRSATPATAGPWAATIGSTPPLPPPAL